MNPLAAHYRRFRVADRLLLSAHSHQAWPDVALEGQVQAFEDAALEVDAKWDRAFAKADEVRAAFRGWLGDPAAELALGANTHELVIRLLSALDLRSRPCVVTTDGEFHTLRRQLARLAEAGVEVVRVAASPVESLAERLADEVDDRTCAVFVSKVLFETSRIVCDVQSLAERCASRGAELVVDAYHALGVVPFSMDGLEEAWIVGGGYKYLQFGEGNCFLRVPPHAADLRPVVTGWFAEFGAIADARRPGAVAYAAGGDRFAGATYDPTSHYRAARVATFFTDQGLTAERLREISLRQNTRLADQFDALDLPPSLITREQLPREAFGGFLALRSPRAGELCTELEKRGVRTDSRGEYLRFGPAPYHADSQLDAAMAALGEVCGD
ncbi:aminotransferase class V-fold PLP-dependent enzyme [Amycolatopsis sp. 195334CR]|uniref:aminotransferase class V-fold PLP-dependent enzyme n=1 Tax=Amycolatopsis sp. 195334CR TaxID=2814588 RepID=UPI001A8F3187|nr:aminotransferase class V-fold PLP-dependent enzyme [Amycolatopsis sp. 195334CR]MBN6037147.1 aminotransferase class V-fold PLP-dependent enzyme [Amycolatopsis sp. 195334CR]